MAIADVLKGMRETGYEKPDAKPEAKPAGQRSFPLTDEEAQSLMPYQQEYQDEIVVEVTGKVAGNEFQVSSVKYAEKPDDKLKPPSSGPSEMPMVRTQTVPYPS